MKFPEINNVADVLPHIKGKPEFAVFRNEELNFGTIMYNVAFEDTFLPINDSLSPDEKLTQMFLRECRGLHFELSSGKILARAYHKFFNANERSETQIGSIDWTIPHTFLEKLDGTMVVPVFAKRLVWCTKRGYFPLSDKIEREFTGDDTIYTKFAHKAFCDGFTPIFEWCSQVQRIILEYEAPRFVLTAVRNNRTGEYMTLSEMRAYAPDAIEIIQPLFEPQPIDVLISTITDLTNMEGVVVRFDSGEMVKIKCKWYRDIHKVVTNLKFDKDIIRLIVEEELDDVKPFLTESYLESINDYERNVVSFWQNKAKELVSDALRARESGISAHEYSKIASAQFLKYSMRAYKGASESEIIEHFKRDIRLWYSNKERLEEHSYIYGHFRLFK